MTAVRSQVYIRKDYNIKCSFHGLAGFMLCRGISEIPRRLTIRKEIWSKNGERRGVQIERPKKECAAELWRGWKNIISISSLMTVQRYAQLQWIAVKPI
jgi:hypothetical protein